MGCWSLTRPLRRLVTANPKASDLYLGFADSSANFHIQAIDLTTLLVILDSYLGVNLGRSMTVSPGPETIYLIGYGRAPVATVRASSLRLTGTVPLKNSFSTAVSSDSSTLTFLPLAESRDEFVMNGDHNYVPSFFSAVP